MGLPAMGLPMMGLPMMGLPVIELPGMGLPAKAWAEAGAVGKDEEEEAAGKAGSAAQKASSLAHGSVLE